MCSIDKIGVMHCRYRDAASHFTVVSFEGHFILCSCNYGHWLTIVKSIETRISVAFDDFCALLIPWLTYLILYVSGECQWSGVKILMTRIAENAMLLLIVIRHLGVEYELSNWIASRNPRGIHYAVAGFKAPIFLSVSKTLVVVDTTIQSGNVLYVLNVRNKKLAMLIL